MLTLRLSDYKVSKIIIHSLTIAVKYFTINGSIHEVDVFVTGIFEPEKVIEVINESGA